jgi:hypothetical protein
MSFLPFVKTIALPAQFHYTSALNYYNSFLFFFGFAFISLDFNFVSGLYYCQQYEGNVHLQGGTT